MERPANLKDVFIVGLTGGLGSGKSTVAGLLAEQGLPVIDTDRVAHELLGNRQGGIVRQIVRHFGPTVLAPDGKVDRAELARIAFSAPEQLQQLQRILHPAIARKVFQQVSVLKAAGARLVVLEVPLLLEVGWDSMVDSVVVVDCTPQQQVERFVARTGATVEQAQARMNAQASRSQRLERAVHVVDNSGTAQELVERVHDVALNLLHAAGTSPAQGDRRGGP